MEMSSRICFLLLLLTVQKDIGRMHICSCEGLGAQEKADHAVDFLDILLNLSLFYVA